jgi:hypothetical protein
MLILTTNSADRPTNQIQPLAPTFADKTDCSASQSRLGEHRFERDCVTLQPMDVNDPLSRLLRLRGMLAESLPEEKVESSDAEALTGAYERARTLALSIAVDVGADTIEFESQFPESAGKPEHMRNQVQAVRTAMHNESVAKTAATLLRQLGGYAGGLIEAIALDQNITAKQVEAAREAARPPLGFGPR